MSVSERDGGGLRRARLSRGSSKRAVTTTLRLVCLSLAVTGCWGSPQFHHGRHHEGHGGGTPTAERLYMSAANNFDPHRDSEEFRRDDERREFTRRDSFVNDFGHKGTFFSMQR